MIIIWVIKIKWRNKFKDVILEEKKRREKKKNLFFYSG